MNYVPATVPTMYFIGVTTGKSSIRRVFVEWAKILGRPEVQLQGIDFPLHADPVLYREAVLFIKNDPLSIGALVTTHKVDLFHACKDLFDEIDPYATLLHEVSSLSKNSNGLRAAAKDPFTAGYSLSAFVQDSHWKNSMSEVVCLGAGGSALALTCHIVNRFDAESGPSRIVVSNRSAKRLEEFESVYRELGTKTILDLVHAPLAAINDQLVSSAPEGSLIINATGLGKDAPGSPLTNKVSFPENGLIWDFNYRGELLFLDQARAQEKERNLVIEDGWVYFLHGWTQVMSEVFHIEIQPEGPLFDELAVAASSVRVVTT